MNRTIAILRAEHRNFEKVLDVLEQELTVFAQCEQPDYDLVRTIILYFKEYPSRCHHPKEDMIFDRLKRRNPEAAGLAGDFEADHRDEAALLQTFTALVESILTDHDLARRVFISAVRDFINFQRQHIRREERLLFPAAVKALRPEDWEEIERRLGNEADPLFNAGTVESSFRSLRDCIVRWEYENQVYRATSL
jgi:hemerythrin-like domain-containing protein